MPKFEVVMSNFAWNKNDESKSPHQTVEVEADVMNLEFGEHSSGVLVFYRNVEDEDGDVEERLVATFNDWDFAIERQ